MQARFAHLAEQTRRWEHSRTDKARERRRVHSLCDAIQLAVADRQHDRVNSLLKEMHGIVDSALAQRRRDVARVG